jgi:hypothetical protein
MASAIRIPLPLLFIILILTRSVPSTGRQVKRTRHRALQEYFAQELPIRARIATLSGKK